MVKHAVLVAALALGSIAGAHAVPVTILAMKLSDSTPAASDLPAWEGWRDPGGFNEGNPAAQLLVDNGLDYKNSIVDTQWEQVISVRVSMYRNGMEQKFIEFDAQDTTKMNFFSAANATASSYTDLGDDPGPSTQGGHHFSIPGESSIDRHWFINNNYGGCPSDVGQWVVLDRRPPPGEASPVYVCDWERNRDHLVGSPDRGFLYAPGSQEANWNNTNVGIADVYAVFVTMESTAVPEPGPLALLGIGGLALAAVRRRRASRA